MLRSLFARLFGKKEPVETPAHDTPYDELLACAVANLKTVNNRAIDEHGFGSFDRWDLDQEEGILRFYDPENQVRIATPVVLLGTYSQVSGTWLWGWANESLREPLTKPLEAVRKFGEERRIEDLTERKTACDESEAWGLAAVAMQILGGQGVYRGPAGKGYTFILMKELTSFPASSAKI